MMRTRHAIRREPRVSAIAPPLLVVTTSPEENAALEHVFASVPDLVVLSVFGRPGAAQPQIDLRAAGRAGGGAQPVTRLSLDRPEGQRTRTKDVAGMIADTVAQSHACTVAIGLGLRGGDGLEASDAALRARRKARAHIRWIVYLDDDPGADPDGAAGRIARRRMLLFARGIRLESVVVADVPTVASNRFWQVRSS